MLSQRLITGPLLVLLLIGLAWIDHVVGAMELKTTLTLGWPMGPMGIDTIPPGLILYIVCCCIIPLAAAELSAMAKSIGIRCSSMTTALFSLLVLTVMWITPALPSNTATTAIAVLAGIICLSFFTALLVASWGKRIDGVLEAAAVTVFFTIYLGLFLGFFLMLRSEGTPIWWIIGIIAIVKMCDSGAYFTGTAIGRHKLIPWLSPGKTWEGLAGGLLASMLTGWGLAALSEAWLVDEPVISMPWGIGIGLLIGLVGQAGDLVMSLLKRTAAVKDSSNMLPGLGGIMDVLDSPLLAAPVGWAVLMCFD
jgi:phosphatidate cytidylyltransferase